MVTATPEAYRLLHEGSQVLAEIEANGVRIHEKRLARTIESTEQTIRAMEEELRADPVYEVWEKEYGNKTNLASNSQLAHILYNKMGIECKAWTSGGKGGKRRPSVSEKALQDVKHPFVDKLFEVRHLQKIVGTFLKGMLRETVNGFLHPFYHLHTAVSFRSSSTEINWQNLPKRNAYLSKLVRRCVVPRTGNYLWELDFKGAEVTTAACVSGDETLQDYVRDNRKDMHRDMAMQLFQLDEAQVTKGIRNLAKQYFVFAEFYGDYYIHCAKNLWEYAAREKQYLSDGTPILKHLRRKGIRGMGDCDPEQSTRPRTFEAHVKAVEEDFWGRRFRGYAAWKKRWWETYQKNGYYLTATGFLVQYGKDGPLSKNDCVNYPIQGPSFHCLLWTLIRLQKWLTKNKMKSLLIGQIHDSALGESPPDEIQDVLNEAYRIIREDLPKHYTWLTVPMDVECEVADIDKSWYDKKEWTRSKKGVWAPKEAA